ncbi:hypothetical protein AVEN_72360-1, partial [Araneus ventricosus]
MSLPSVKRDVRNDRRYENQTPSSGREKAINVPRAKRSQPNRDTRIDP